MLCTIGRINKCSYLSQLNKDLENLLNYNVENCDKKLTLDILRKKFSCGNQGLVDSVRVAMASPGGGHILRLLLRVEFGDVPCVMDRYDGSTGAGTVTGGLNLGLPAFDSDEREALVDLNSVSLSSPQFDPDL